MLHKIVLDGANKFGRKMNWSDAVENYRTSHHCQYGIDDAQMCCNAHLLFLLLKLSQAFCGLSFPQRMQCEIFAFGF